MSLNLSLAQLDAQRKNYPKLGPDVTQGQTAAVNLMPLVDEVWDLIKLSKQGKKLPQEVSEQVYPGKVLPPGDVIEAQHLTHAPQGQNLQAIDPAMWGSKYGPGLTQNTNPEAQFMQRFPDLNAAYFYAHGEAPETDIARAATGEFHGAIPGMYNLDRDPDGLYDLAKAEYELEMYSRPENMRFDQDPKDLEARVQRELRRRGYAGGYKENTGVGDAATLLTPVDTQGQAPNIDAMRVNLGRPVGAGEAERRLEGLTDYAQVNTETMPGAEYWASRYRGYQDNPSAGAMLHADYERLLRDPDGGSVVARELGVEDPPVRQGQGVYAGQRNPVAAARIKVSPPKITPNDDPALIIERGRLTTPDRDRLDAIAVTEGMLRDQDAVAWSYPVYMTPEDDMAVNGLPWGTVNSAIFRSPGLRHVEVGMAADSLRKLPLPEKYVDEWTKTWEDMISVTEPPDGQGGVMFTNVSDDLSPQDFQQVIRDLRAQHASWVANRSMETLWGRADSGYVGADDFAKRITELPEGLRKRAEETLTKYDPYVRDIRGYHDKLRGVQNPEAPKRME